MLYSNIDINNQNVLSLSEELLSSPDFLQYYLNNYNGDYKNFLLFRKSAYTSNNIKLFYEKIKKFNIDYIFDLKFKDSHYSLNKCLKTGNYKYIYYYEKQAFTLENIKLFIDTYFDSNELYVPQFLFENKDFLLGVIKYDRFELLDKFSDQLFDDSIIDEIILKINAGVKFECNAYFINNNDRILKTLILNGDLNSFFKFNNKARTNENIELFLMHFKNDYKFKSEIINYIDDDITNNAKVLECLLKSDNVKLINKFSNDCYNDKNKELFISLYKKNFGKNLKIPKCLYSDSDLLSYILDNNICDYYLFSSLAYNSDNIKKLNSIIETNGGMVLNDFYAAVKDSASTLNNLFIYNKFFEPGNKKFTSLAYNKENTDLFFDYYINNRGSIPECLLNSNYLLKKFLDNNLLSDVVKYNLSVYSEEDKINLINKIKSKVFIDFRGASNSILTDSEIFYECLKNADIYNLSCFHDIKCDNDMAILYFNNMANGVEINLSDEMLVDLINSNTMMLLSYMKQSDNNKEVVLDLLLDNPNNNIYDEKFYDTVKDFILTEFGNFGYDVKNIDLFIKTFGYKAIIYIWAENKNVLSVLKLDDTKFSDFINLFKKCDLTNDNVINIYDSISQHKFVNEYSSDLKIFHDILKRIENNEECNDLLLKLIDYTDVVYRDDSDLFKNEYLKKLVNIIKNGSIEEKKNSINELHIITDNYLKCLRESYRNEHLNDYKKSLKSNVVGIDLEKLKIKYLVSTNKNLVINYLNSIKNDKVINEIVKDSNLFNACLDYILDNSINDFENTDINLVRRSIKNINNSLYGLFDKNVKVINNEVWDKLYSNSKKSYVVDKNNNELFNVFTNINLDKIFDIIEDKDKYYSLKKVLDKYKFISWDKNVYEELGNIGYDINSLNLSSFIDNFDIVYNKQGLEDIKLIDLVKYIRMYSKSSDKYKKLFLDEDYELLKNNPAPRAAFGITETERLNRGVLDSVQMFRRNNMKIPSLKKTVFVNDKCIDVVIGDFKDPSTLTLGERTASCMRIGGVGEELYNFCLYEDAGFHIVFKNSFNNNFVSRVSGFRNGNTVFLNELRDSVDDGYSNKDLIKALECVGSELIRLTKDSTCPIENIFIYKDFAMKDSNKREYDFNVSSCKQGLGQKFYSDINNCGVVISTSGSSDFVPIVTGNKMVDNYKSIRNDPVYVENFDDAKQKIDRIYIMSQLLKQKMLFECDNIDYTNGINYAYIGDDFYIYKDYNNKTHSCLLSVDDRAIDEFNYYLELVNNKTKSK